MIRLKKQQNGNVLITDQTDKVLFSFNAGMNTFKHPHIENSLIITDDASLQEVNKGLVISFDSVDMGNCYPVINAIDINELITVLSNSFFFRKPAETSISNQINDMQQSLNALLLGDNTPPEFSVMAPQAPLAELIPLAEGYSL